MTELKTDFKGLLYHIPESLHHFEITWMVYQHEIEEKEGFKWYTIFHLFKLLELFQNYNPYIGIQGTLLACPPNRIQFFRFCMCFCWKAHMSEVGTPQQVSTPQQKILDPPLPYH